MIHSNRIAMISTLLLICALFSSPVLSQGVTTLIEGYEYFDGVDDYEEFTTLSLTMQSSFTLVFGIAPANEQTFEISNIFGNDKFSVIYDASDSTLHATMKTTGLPNSTSVNVPIPLDRQEREIRIICEETGPTVELTIYMNGTLLVRDYGGGFISPITQTTFAGGRPTGENFHGLLWDMELHDSIVFP